MSNRSSRVRLAADYPTGVLRAPYRAGALVRLRRGAYVPVEATEEAGQILDRCVAVARQLRVTFAFSHQTAVLLHGLPDFSTRFDLVHVLQRTRPSGSRASDLIPHVAKDLPDADITTVHDLPVTTLERTCLDCARSLSPQQGLAVADAVLRRLCGTTRFNWPGPGAQEQQLRDRWLSRIEHMSPARGVVRARAVLAHADGRAESPAESQVRWLVLTEGFIAPDLQVAVVTKNSTYYPDLLWSGAAVRSGWRAVALEYDGAVKYAATDDLYQEKIREDALRSAGCMVIRATKADLRDPGRLLRELRDHVVTDPEAAQLRRALRTTP